MQIRHTDRKQYFLELSHTTEQYFIPFIKTALNKEIDENVSVLEIGCGEGGNLLPFAKLGCKITGIDLSQVRIEQAKQFFGEELARKNGGGKSRVYAS